MDTSFSDYKSKRILKKYPFLLKLPEAERKHWVEVYKTLPSDTSGRNEKEFSVDALNIDKVATERAFTLKYGKRPKKETPD